MITVAHLWRHPIKSHGREEVEATDLTAGQTMPFDRHWAVTHDRTTFDSTAPEWVRCRNFMIGVSTPGLAGLWARLDEGTGQITLRHMALGEIAFHPDAPDDVARFLAWVAPLSEGQSLRPTGLVHANGRGLTDSPEATVSVMNLASHAAVSARLGGALEPERWRGNIWLDGLAPWQEMEWVGQRLRIGGAVLEVLEPIERCKHTMANPTTGKRDADTLSVLDAAFGHAYFGMNCLVVESGRVERRDAAEVL